MLTAPIPHNEAERQRSLEHLAVLDTAPEREFDALVATAALVCGVPISLISLIDGDRQWFKANVGLPGVPQTPRDVAFCAHAILHDGIFEVPDALADPRFADNPLVICAPDIRFYAGVPLRLGDGAHVGTLCVIDRVPHQLTDPQREVLRLLSIAAVQALESRRMARDFVASEARFRTFCDAAPLGVFAADAAGGCTYANARWQATFGLTEAEALRDGWTRALHPDDKTTVFEQWQRAVALQQDFELEFRLLHGDGRVRDVRAVSRPVLDLEGRITSHVGSIQDITEQLAALRCLADERQRLADLEILHGEIGHGGQVAVRIVRHDGADDRARLELGHLLTIGRNLVRRWHRGRPGKTGRGSGGGRLATGQQGDSAQQQRGKTGNSH